MKRASSINAIATGADTIVAGRYLRKDLGPATYSASGPITPTRAGALHIVEAILAGRTDQALVVEQLERPLPWEEQRRQFLAARPAC